MAVKIFLNEDEIPRQWYNIAADMPNPMQPPLHPGTGQPLGPQDLAPVFPMNLIEQEVSQERWIDIPDEVLDKYLIWRPSPLYRAVRLEKLLDCPVKIYYKNEGVSPAGSHKPNTAIPQVYYNKVFGINRRGPVGERSGLRLQSVRARSQGLHGPCKLRAEALSPINDEHMGRDMHPQPQH